MGKAIFLFQQLTPQQDFSKFNLWPEGMHAKKRRKKLINSSFWQDLEDYVVAKTQRTDKAEKNTLKIEIDMKFKGTTFSHWRNFIWSEIDLEK